MERAISATGHCCAMDHVSVVASGSRSLASRRDGRQAAVAPSVAALRFRDRLFIDRQSFAADMKSAPQNYPCRAASAKNDEVREIPCGADFTSAGGASAAKAMSAPQNAPVQVGQRQK